MARGAGPNELQTSIRLSRELHGRLDAAREGRPLGEEIRRQFLGLVEIAETGRRLAAVLGAFEVDKPRVVLQEPRQYASEANTGDLFR